MALRLVAWAWVAVFVVVWLMIMAAGVDPETLCPDAPEIEGSSLGVELTLWPPGGVECLWVGPRGDELRHARFPWDVWLSGLLLAAGGACASTAAFRARGRRLRWAAATVALVIGAGVAWLL